MWKISRRAVEVQESPIRKLIPYSDAAKERGIHVYHLNIGQPDIETPPEFWNAVKNYPKKVLEYGHSQGQAPYRKVLSGYYKKNGLAIGIPCRTPVIGSYHTDVTGLICRISTVGV